VHLEDATAPKKQSINIDNIRSLIEDDMNQVNSLIERGLYSDVELISQLGHYIINSGGKRLRPALVLLSANCFGYKGTQHYNLAAIIEFIHTATLLHDDVVDASLLRRGQVTANQRWGNEASVLVGDFVYSRAFQMMVNINSMRVMNILSDATNTIAEGEVLQLINRHDPETTEERYLAVCRNKTAKLFEAAAQLGAVISERSKVEEQSISAYGRHLGTAFQLIDDVLDYSSSSDALGKNIGDDLGEGKPTLPLLYALWNGDEKQSSIIRNAIENGGLDDIEQITNVIHATGALDYASEIANKESQLAIDALNNLPASKYLDAMYSLAIFSIEREY